MTQRQDKEQPTSSAKFHVTKDGVGYYLDASQPRDQPSKDAAPVCVICGEPWTEDTVRTHGVMWEAERVISLFYRTHRDCHNALTPEQDGELAQAVLALGDDIARGLGRISGESHGNA